MLQFTIVMDIVFRKSAFEHKITELAIREAFNYPHYDGPIEDNGNKNRFLRLGFDNSGNLLEILYNEYENCVCIFHAMKCRSIFFNLIEY